MLDPRGHVPDDRSLSLDFTARPSRPPAEEPRPLTVGELDRAIKGSVEGTFESPVWVEGEVADSRPAPSGHLYFCLKDEREEASIDAVVYRSNVTARTRQLCVDGARIRLRGKPTLWTPRGRLQFVADRAQAVGRGALLEAIERLKVKLASEGLFAAERKRPLPGDPRTVGVVTSPGGAVIHDVCRVAFRRGGARILLAPAQVQGAVIVLGRGGGSADDLGVFNEEAVVRAVAGCRVPVVSAVGHDVDVTLVDFAADARAATPSQAAEMIVPDRRARRQLLRRTGMHLARAVHARLSRDSVALARVAGRLGDPRLAIAAHQQALDERAVRLTAGMRASLGRRREALARGQRRLAYLHPRAVVARERAEVARLRARIASLWGSAFERRLSSLRHAASRLDALSPLKVLARGYAIATRDDGRAVRTASDVGAGDALHVRVRDARIETTVVKVEPTDAS
jgi:exodeoxyribonuclease VII large subunit